MAQRPGKPVRVSENMPVRMRNNDGFTLIELMFGLMIIAISMGALYYMFMQGQTMMIEQEHRALALQRVKWHMVQKEVEYRDPDLDFETGTFERTEFLIPPQEEDEETAIQATYIIEAEIVDDRRQVTITYRWVEWSGRDYELTVKKTLVRLGDSQS